MMNFNEFTIKIEKTARYFVNETDIKKVKNFYLVLHGYAQLASDFIADFEFLNKNDTLILAPEGLSKFYFRNNIGASWMTKEDRNNEICDYLNYLEKLLKKVNNEFDLTSAEINLLGFSQGVHSAVRFFIDTEFKFNNLLLCSSDFPKDIDFEKFKSKMTFSKVHFIYGKKDEIINLKRYRESISLLNQHNIGFNVVEFDGGHKIDPESISASLLK